MRLGNVWQWEGRVDRGTYATVGVTAFVLKFLIDWLVVTRFFGRSWSLLSYWRPFGAISGIRGLRLEDWMFAGTMLLLAVPFIWLGLAMTVSGCAMLASRRGLRLCFLRRLPTCCFFWC